MTKITKLSTSMGVELTFMPVAMQWCVDALDPEYQKHPDSCIDVYEQNVMCACFVGALRQYMTTHSIPFYKCSQDPGCVEVPTKPYTTLNELTKVCRQIWKAADKFCLLPELPSFNGGGAHIHTGVVGKSSKERQEYIGRMAVFANHNPWLSWAFIGSSDSINAEPIPARHIRDREEAGTLEDIEQGIAYLRDSIQRETRMLHRPGQWTSAGLRRVHERTIERFRANYLNARRKWLTLRGKRANDIPVAGLELHDCRETMLRLTYYGDHGTIEFRNFEMPGDMQTLTKYILLVDAIVTHVKQQDYDTIPASALFEKEDFQAMTWRQRRAGFINMLVMLGLDPDDWRAERVQIALRMRAQRPAKPKAEQAADDATYALAA